VVKKKRLLLRRRKRVTESLLRQTIAFRHKREKTTQHRRRIKKEVFSRTVPTHHENCKKEKKGSVGIRRGRLGVEITLKSFLKSPLVGTKINKKKGMEKKGP